MRNPLKDALTAREISRRTPAPAHVIFKALREGFTAAEVEKSLDWMSAHNVALDGLLEFLRTMRELREHLTRDLLYGTGSAEPRGILNEAELDLALYGNVYTRPDGTRVPPQLVRFRDA